MSGGSTVHADDARLIERYLQGDAAAVAEIDRWITAAARSYARRLGDRSRDVEQDARLEIFQLLSAGRFHGRSRLKTYLWQVVNHTCLDAVRSSSRRVMSELEESTEMAAISSLRAKREAAAFEVTDLVLRVLQEVPEACLQIWSMILDGYSYQEMSHRLSIPSGALRVKALRCRKKAQQVRERLSASARGTASG